MSEGPAKRRWFRFGLLALFVAVSVLGIFLGWLGYQLTWIRQRRSLVADFPKWTAFEGQPGTSMAQPDAPGLLWAFGEDGYSRVMLALRDGDAEQNAETQAELQNARRLFPEAVVMAIPHDAGSVLEEEPSTWQTSP